MQPDKGRTKTQPGARRALWGEKGCAPERWRGVSWHREAELLSHGEEKGHCERRESTRCAAYALVATGPAASGLTTLGFVFFYFTCPTLTHTDLGSGMGAIPRRLG